MQLQPIFLNEAISAVGITTAKYERPICALDCELTIGDAAEFNGTTITSAALKTLLAGFFVTVVYEPKNGDRVTMQDKTPLHTILQFGETEDPVCFCFTALGEDGKRRVNKIRFRLFLGQNNIPLIDDQNVVITIHTTETRAGAVLTAYPYTAIMASEVYDEIATVTVSADLREKTYKLDKVSYLLLPFDPTNVEGFELSPDAVVSARKLERNWENIRLSDLLAGDTSFTVDNLRVPTTDCIFCLPVDDFADFKILKANTTAPYTFFMVMTKQLPEPAFSLAMELNGGGANG